MRKTTKTSLLAIARISGVAAGVTVVATSATATFRAVTELARINNRVITLNEFNRRYHEDARFFLSAQAPTPRVILDELIKRELGVQEARREGLDRDPEVREAMDTVLYRALINKKLAPRFDRITVSDNEARAFYARNPEIRTSNIFVAVPWDARPDADRAARARIEKIYNEYIRPGRMGFAEIAQRYSEGPAAPMGGDLGFETRDKLDPAYYQAALRLRIGETSPIIRSQFGYHIIKLTDKRPWEETDHALIKRLVIEERRDQIYESYMAQLRSKARIVVHNEYLTN